MSKDKFTKGEWVVVDSLIASAPEMYEEIQRDIIEIEARLTFADERTLAVNPDVAKLKRKKAILSKARG